MRRNEDIRVESSDRNIPFPRVGAVGAEDEVVEEGDGVEPADGDEFARKFNVFFARVRIARWVVVGHDDSRCTPPYRIPERFGRIDDRRVLCAARELDRFAKRMVSPVQRQHPEVFLVVAHRRHFPKDATGIFAAPDVHSSDIVRLRLIAAPNKLERRGQFHLLHAADSENAPVGMRSIVFPDARPQRSPIGPDELAQRSECGYKPPGKFKDVATGCTGAKEDRQQCFVAKIGRACKPPHLLPRLELGRHLLEAVGHRRQSRSYFTAASISSSTRAFAAARRNSDFAASSFDFLISLFTLFDNCLSNLGIGKSRR